MGVSDASPGGNEANLGAKVKKLFLETWFKSLKGTHLGPSLDPKLLCAVSIGHLRSE